MMEGFVIYRGFEIEVRGDGRWVVTLRGEEVHTADTEASALMWVDDERRRETEKGKR